MDNLKTTHCRCGQQGDRCWRAGGTPKSPIELEATQNESISGVAVAVRSNDDCGKKGWRTLGVHQTNLESTDNPLLLLPVAMQRPDFFCSMTRQPGGGRAEENENKKLKCVVLLCVVIVNEGSTFPTKTGKTLHLWRGKKHLWWDDENWIDNLLKKMTRKWVYMRVNSQELWKTIFKKLTKTLFLKM